MRPNGIGGWLAQTLVVALLCLSTLGCATASNHALPKAVSQTLKAAPDVALSQISATLLAPLDAGSSQVHPLQSGLAALAARLALIELAQSSIDIQVYIWRDDESGRGLAAALWLAASRGVRVRVLLDDWGAGLPDAMLAQLDQHPNIELRLFNPLAWRQVRWLSALLDFSQANRRMHNKAMVVDGQMSIVGGRNLGDEYFERRAELEFGDLDLLATGPVVAEVAASFDAYWNSAWAAPVEQLIAAPSNQAPQEAPADRGVAWDSAFWHRVRDIGFAQQLRSGDLHWYAGIAQALADPPDKLMQEIGPERPGTLQVQLSKAVQSANHEVILISPYFVPGDNGVAMLQRLRNQGVRVQVITNSLAATDVPAVHSGYANYRKALLAMGVDLYEVRADAPCTGGWRQVVGSAGSSRVSLHAKTFVFDRRHAFVGSLNLDLRSVRLNNEIGLVIDSPALANALVQGLQQQLPESSYQVKLQHGQLLWTSHQRGQTQQWTHEPQTSLWLRLSIWLMSLLPLEVQL